MFEPPGILIAFEGIDGAGKTTQVRLLADALTSIGESPVCSKEPTDGVWGRRIRSSALSGRMDLDAELAAFIKDREEHADSLVLPSLHAGAVVILDRYYYSTIAYQGARGADTSGLKEAMESRFRVPDVVFVLDVDPRVSVTRIASGRGEVPNEFERVEELDKARSIFLSLRDANVVVLDAARPPEDLRAAILTVLLDGVLKDRLCMKGYGCDDPLSCIYRLTSKCKLLEARRSMLATRSQASSARMR